MQGPGKEPFRHYGLKVLRGMGGELLVSPVQIKPIRQGQCGGGGERGCFSSGNEIHARSHMLIWIFFQ